MGAMFTQNIDSRWQHFSLGSNIELRQIEGSPNLGRRRDAIGSIWTKEELLFQDNVTLAGFGRYDRYLGSSYAGVGVDAKLRLGSHLAVIGGVSASRRVPTYEELFWSDSTVGRTGPIEAEKHRQAEIGAALDLDSAQTLRASYFVHTVENPILITEYGNGSVFPGVHFANAGRVTTQGLEAKVSLLLRWLELEGTATYLTQQDNDGTTLQRYPKFSASGGIYYRNKLFQNELEIKVGFRGRYQSAHMGEEFNPEVLAYVPGRGPTLGSGSSVDFFLIAHIGDAYVHLMWENLTGIQYYTTPFYPVLDREVRFGISWEFLN
jgi:outer membrane cobalamin receptor